MSDPTRPPHHGDEPPRYPMSGQGAFGMAPAGPPQSGAHAGEHPPPQQPPVYRDRPAGLSQEEQTWGGAAHWSALVASLLGGLAVLGPLIVFLVKGSQSPHIRRHAVESLNFQISIMIYVLVSIPLMFVLVGFFTIVAALLGWLVLTIIGSVKASQGEDYRYPLTIRMVS